MINDFYSQLVRITDTYTNVIEAKVVSEDYTRWRSEVIIRCSVTIPLNQTAAPADPRYPQKRPSKRYEFRYLRVYVTHHDF